MPNYGFNTLLWHGQTQGKTGHLCYFALVDRLSETTASEEV